VKDEPVDDEYPADYNEYDGYIKTEKDTDEYENNYNNSAPYDDGYQAY